MFECRLPGCDSFVAPLAVMCRPHWRAVPTPIRLAITKLIMGTPVDPRRNPNPTKKWKILVDRAIASVFTAQGKTDQANEILIRAAKLDKK